MNHSDVFLKKFISINDVRSKAPSCFTSIVSKEVSDKYVFVHTPDVLEKLSSIGWRPIDAYQVTPKLAKNVGFQKHFIKLRNDKYFVGDKNNISIVPELLLVNSYDAKCSFKFYITLYRVVSDSVMIMKTDELLNESGDQKFRLLHKANSLSTYFGLTDTFEDSIEVVLNLMNKMKKIDLTDKQQKSLAQLAVRARWDYTYQLKNTDSILDPIRDEDEKNDLLTVSYRLQEKLVKGGWTGAGGRAIKPIKDPNRELTINQKFFSIIENYYQQLSKTSNK